MKQYDIGIDLGTTSIIIATEEQGVVFRQPTIGAVDTRTNSIIAVGDEALKMVGRAPAHIDLVRPLRDGIIQDHRMTNELIVRFVNEVCRSRIFKPRIAVCVPAAITGIDQTQYEAAAIDGVNAWQKFWKITFPLIGPFFTINLVLSMKNALGTFDQVVALTEGGPNSSTETVTYLIWKGGLTGGEYAYQTANAVLFFIVLAIIAFVQLRISRSQEQI